MGNAFPAFWDDWNSPQDASYNGYLPPNYGTTATGIVTGTTTLAQQAVFYTWLEAVLQANEISERFTTVGKPRVQRVGDGWVVTYNYRPVLMNGIP